MRLADVVEAELGDDSLPLATRRDFVAERLLERLGGVAEGRNRIGIDRRSLRSCLWLASQPDSLLGFANRPAAARGVAGKAAADVVAAGSQESLAVAFAEITGLKHPQGLVRQLEQADQVGNGGAAAAHPFRQLLFRQPQLLDQRRAGPRLLDRVE